MRRAERTALHALVILAMLAAPALAAGCGGRATVEQAPTGKPAVLNFWQPG